MVVKGGGNVPEELDKLEQEGLALSTRDFTLELSFKRGNKEAESGFSSQAWFNSWHDFGLRGGLNTPWFEIVFEACFTDMKGGKIPFAAAKLVRKMLAVRSTPADKPLEKTTEDRPPGQYL
jgi:hypothetical protein